MIEQDVLTKALDFQDSQLSLLKLQLAVASDSGESPVRIQERQAEIEALETNNSALIPQLNLANATTGDWGQLDLQDVVVQDIDDLGFGGTIDARNDRVFFAGWGVESNARLEIGDHCSIVGGATVSRGQDNVLVVRRSFAPEELRSAIISVRSKGRPSEGFPEWNRETERIPSDASRKWRSAKVVGITLALVTLFVITLASRTRQKPDDFGRLTHDQLVVKVEPAVVRLDVDKPNGSVLASGFVLDETGIVVTNYHVIDGARSANALFADDTTLPVIGVLATDAERDIAILKLQPPKVKKLATLTLRSAFPKKGESVIAFGSPHGLDFTMTQGMVSAIRKPEEKIVMDMELKGSWIQTDTAISEGSSGGPLVDLLGNVVGMNTFGLRKGDNLNFAVSASDIATVFQTAKGAALMSFKLEAVSTAKSLANKLLGRWESAPTGEVYSIAKHSDGLIIEVVSSRSLIRGRGIVTLSESRNSWVGKFSAIFAQDKSRQERYTQIEITIISADKLGLVGEWVTWDGTGREKKRERVATFLSRRN